MSLRTELEATKAERDDLARRLEIEARALQIMLVDEVPDYICDDYGLTEYCDEHCNDGPISCLRDKAKVLIAKEAGGG